MREKPIVIYGASGFGREVVWLVDACVKHGEQWKVACFADDDKKKQGKTMNGVKVMSLEDSARCFPGAFFIPSVGDPRIREQMIGKAIALGLISVSIVHPSVEKSSWIEIGEGSLICSGSILTTNIKLGCYVQINLGCSIGHDVVMGEFTTLAPGVHVSGWVHFGKRVYIGTGAVFINGTEKKYLTIGDDAIIGAGAVVTNSVPANEVWGGVPARSLSAERR